MGESYTDGIVSENVEVDLSSMNDSYENTRRSAQKQDLSKEAWETMSSKTTFDLTDFERLVRAVKSVKGDEPAGCCCAPSCLYRSLHYFQGSAPGMLEIFEENIEDDGNIILPVLDFFVNSVLRSIGQVAFCDNPWSGLLISFSIVSQFHSMGGPFIYGFVSTIVSNIFALIVVDDKNSIRHGLFGFNAFLVGIALPIFINPSGSFSGSAPDFDLLFAIIILSMLTVVLSAAFNSHSVKLCNTPVFTLPFNLVVLLFLLMSENPSSHFKVNINMIKPSQLSLVYEEDADVTSFNPSIFFKAMFKGISEIFIVDSAFSGGLMLFAFFLYSRISAVAAILGSCIGMFTATIIGAYTDRVALGLWGYNSVLTMMALWGVFVVPNAKSFLIATLATVVTVFFCSACMRIFFPWGLPVLTLPFVIATMIFMLIKDSFHGISFVDLDSISTPEEHLFQHSKKIKLLKRKRRLDREKKLLKRGFVSEDDDIESGDIVQRRSEENHIELENLSEKLRSSLGRIDDFREGNLVGKQKKRGKPSSAANKVVNSAIPKTFLPAMANTFSPFSVHSKSGRLHFNDDV